MLSQLRQNILTRFDFRDCLPRFTADPRVIRRRVRARLTISEAVGVFSAFGFLAIVVYLHATTNFAPYDYGTYTSAAVQHDFYGYYYADWVLPIFIVLDALPGILGVLLWSVANVLAVFLAARVFGGNVLIIMTSYQLFYTLYYGNIIGVIVGALALFWWALAARRWYLAGLALLLAGTKYQVGAPVGLALLLLADISWQERARVLIVPILLGLLSLVVYPLWPLDTLDRLQHAPPGDWASITLWRWIGPLALVLWVPVLTLPLKRPQRVVGIVAALALATPYFQQTDLLLLYALPVGILGILNPISYIYLWYQWEGLRVLMIIPMIAYGVVIGPALYSWWTTGRKSRHEARLVS